MSPRLNPSRLDLFVLRLLHEGLVSWYQWSDVLQPKSHKWAGANVHVLATHNLSLPTCTCTWSDVDNPNPDTYRRHSSPTFYMYASYAASSVGASYTSSSSHSYKTVAWVLYIAHIIRVSIKRSTVKSEGGALECQRMLFLTWLYWVAGRLL